MYFQYLFFIVNMRAREVKRSGIVLAEARTYASVEAKLAFETSSSSTERGEGEGGEGEG